MKDDIATVIALDVKRMRAMVAIDLDTLHDLIADDVVYTHSNALRDSKASLIESLRSGATLYRLLEASEVQAIGLGESVVLTGIARAEVLVDGKAASFVARFTDVWAHRGGTWQMVAWQSTKLAL
jgi:ketosteroid isomerase-like protein